MEFIIVEPRSLAECEEVIERGLISFFEAGKALWDIREFKLYQPVFATFKEYCKQRWDMIPGRARQLIGAAKVVINLEKQSATAVAPIHEKQVRPLVRLKPEQQCAAWAKATANGEKPTEQKVEKIAQKIAPRLAKKKARLPDDIEEVTYLLKASDRDISARALDPDNKDWEKAAVEFFASLRTRNQKYENKKKNKESN
jgi:hypothetical protein